MRLGNSHYSTISDTLISGTRLNKHIIVTTADDGVFDMMDDMMEDMMEDMMDDMKEMQPEFMTSVFHFPTRSAEVQAR